MRLPVFSRIAIRSPFLDRRKADTVLPQQWRDGESAGVDEGKRFTVLRPDPIHHKEAQLAFLPEKAKTGQLRVMDLETASLTMRALARVLVRKLQSETLEG